MIVTHHVADDPGAFHVPAVRPEATVEHRVQDLAVHRLEAIADVGERAPHDHAHRVVEVGALHFDLEADRLDAAALGGQSADAGYRVGRQDVVAVGRLTRVVGPIGRVLGRV